MTAIDGARFDDLMSELDRSIEALLAPVERDPAVWQHTLPGKWCVGQHCEHVALALEMMPPLFADSARRQAEGTLPPPPVRWLLQALFIAMVVKGGKMPRGGPAHPATFPAEQPPLPQVAGRLRAAPGQYRAPASGLDPVALDQLWIRNPIMTKFSWHYSLPEAVRVQAVHVRHHATQVLEATRS